MEKRNRKAGSRYSLRDRILAQIMIVLVTVTMLPYESLVVHAASTTTVKSIGSIQTEYEVDNGTSKDEIGLPSSLSVVLETVTSAEGSTEETAPAVSEETVDKSVSWHGDYDGSTAGTYALTASFDDSSLSYSNMPTVHVTVKEAETEPEPTTPEVNKTEDEDGDDDEDPDQGKPAKKASDEEETEEEESAKKDAKAEGEEPSTPAAAADLYYGHPGAEGSVDTIEITFSDDKNTALAADNINYTIGVQTYAAARYKYDGQNGEAMFTTWNHITLKVKLPKNVEITSAASTIASYSCTDPATNEWTLVLENDSRQAEDGHSFNFTFVGHIKGNGILPDKTVLDPATVELSTDFDVWVDTDKTQTRNFERTVTASTDPITLSTPDEWILTKSPYAPPNNYTVDTNAGTVTVHYLIKYGLNVGDVPTSDPNAYTRHGRVPYAENHGPKLTDIPTLTLYDGSTIDAQSMTVTPAKAGYVYLDGTSADDTTGKPLPITVTPNTAVEIPYAVVGASENDVAATAPAYSEYKVDMVYDYDEFMVWYYENPDDTDALSENTAKIKYTLAGQDEEKKTEDDGETPIPGYIPPGQITIEKYIVNYNNAQKHLYDSSIKAPVTGAAQYKVFKADGTTAATIYYKDANDDYQPISGNTLTINPAAAASSTNGTAGSISFYLDAGTYVIKETAAPANTEVTPAGDQTQTITVNANGSVKAAFNNKEKLGQVKIKKVDDSNNHKPVTGAVFGLYNDSAFNDPVLNSDGQPYQVTTNSSGEATFTRLVPDTYYLKEESVPSGYIIENEDCGSVTVTANNTTDAAIEVENHINGVTIELIKKYSTVTDPNTFTEVTTDYAKFSGKFKLQQSVDGGATWTDYASTDNPYGIDNTGHTTIAVPEYSGTTKIQYRFVETIPSGYFNTQGTTESVTSDAITPADGQTSITMYNMQGGKITLTKWKTTLNTKSGKYSSDVQSGRTFALYYVEAGSNEAVFVKNATSNSKGIATFEGLPSASNGKVRTYYVIETNPETNFNWDTDSTINVNGESKKALKIGSFTDSSTLTRDVYNTTTATPFWIVKKDAFNGSRLADAKIKVYDAASGERTVTTSAASDVLTWARVGDKITFTEIAVPDGYYLDSTPKELDTTGWYTKKVGNDYKVYKADGTEATQADRTITFTDAPMPKIRVQKKVKAEGQADSEAMIYDKATFKLYVKNADGTFSPYKRDGAEVTLTSRDNVNAIVDAGTYYLHEEINGVSEVINPDVKPDLYAGQGEYKDGKFYFGPYEVKKPTSAATVNVVIPGDNKFIMNYSNIAQLTVEKELFDEYGIRANIKSPTADNGFYMYLHQVDSEGHDVILGDPITTGTKPSNGDIVNGQATFEKLPVYDEKGNKYQYYVEEKLSAAQKKLFDIAHTKPNDTPGQTDKVELTSGETADAGIITNFKKAAVIAVKKYKDMRENQLMGSVYNLAGAEIALYGNNGDGTYTYLGIAKTNASGQAVFSDLPYYANGYVAIEVSIPDKPDYEFMVPTEGIMLEKVDGELPETLTDVSQYSRVALTKDTDPVYRGTIWNQIPWTQIHITKWGKHKDSPDSEYKKIDGTNFILYKQVLPEGTTGGELSFDKENCSVVGTYTSGTWLLNGVMQQGELQTAVLDNADNIVYWIVEDKPTPGYAPVPGEEIILFHRAGTTYTNNSTSKYGNNCTRTKELEDNKINYDDVHNLSGTGPGEGTDNIAYILFSKWRETEEGGYELMPNATFQLWAVNNEGKRVKLLDTITTGDENTMNPGDTTSGHGVSIGIDAWELYDELAAKYSAAELAKIMTYTVRTHVDGLEDTDPYVVDADGTKHRRAGTFKLNATLIEVAGSSLYDLDTHYHNLEITFPTGLWEKGNDKYFVTDINGVPVCDNGDNHKNPLIDPYDNYHNVAIVDRLSKNHPVVVRHFGYDPEVVGYNMMHEDLEAALAANGANFDDVKVKFKIEKYDEEAGWQNWFFDPHGDEEQGASTKEETFEASGNGFSFPDGLKDGLYRITRKDYLPDYENFYDTTPFYFEVTASDQVQVFTTYSPEKPDLKIKKVDFAGNVLTDEATFKLESVGKSNYDKEAVTENGVALFEGLHADTKFKLQEIAAPDGYTTRYFNELFQKDYPAYQDLVTNTGYEISYETKEVENNEINPDGNRKIKETVVVDKPYLTNFTLTAKNAQLLQLEITKVDAQATDSKLDGAKYNVFFKPFDKVSGDYTVPKYSDSDSTWELIGSDYETSGGGTVLIEDLEPGVYYVVETKAPEGYDLNTTGQTIVMTGGLDLKIPAPTKPEDYTVFTGIGGKGELTFKNMPKTGLKIYKEVEFGDFPATNYSFQFELRDSNNTLIAGDPATATGKAKDGEITETTFAEYKELSQGDDYYLKETAVNGYKITQVKSGDTVLTPEASGTFKGSYKIHMPDDGTGVSVTVTNTYMAAKVTIFKYDGETEEGLAGATFDVRTDKDNDQSVVTGADITDNHDGSYTFVIPISSTDGQTFYIHEVESPDKETYVIDEENRDIEVLTLKPGDVREYTFNGKDASNNEYVLPNYVGAHIAVTKYGGLQGNSETKPLAGAQLQLFYSTDDGATWNSWHSPEVTKADGSAEFLILEGYTYAIAETSDVNGFIGLHDVIANGTALETTTIQGYTAFILGKDFESGETFDYLAYNLPYLELEVNKEDLSGTVNDPNVDFHVYEVPNGTATTLTRDEITALIAQNAENHWQLLENSTTNSTYNNKQFIMPGKTYLAVEDKAFDPASSDDYSIILDDSRVVSYEVFAVPLVNYEKKYTVTFKNIKGEVTRGIEKSVDKATVDSLVTNEAELTYTVVPDSTNTYALDAYRINDTGLRVVPTTATLADEWYNITEVTVGQGDMDTYLVGADPDKAYAIYATVTFVGFDGTKYEQTPVNVTAGNQTVMNTTGAKIKSFYVDYKSDDLVTDARYALGQNFKANEMIVKATVFKQEKPADGGSITAIKEIYNDADIAVTYTPWSSKGVKQTPTTLRAKDDAKTVVDAVPAPKIQFDKTGPAGTVDIGDVITYTLTVTNVSDGEVDLTDPVVVDLLPQGMNVNTNTEYAKIKSKPSTIEDDFTCSVGAAGDSQYVNMGFTGTLAKGEKLEIELDAVVTNAVTNYGNTLTNFAFTTSKEVGVATAENQAGAKIQDPDGNWAVALEAAAQGQGVDATRASALKNALGELGTHGYLADMWENTWKTESEIVGVKAEYGPADEQVYSTTRVSVVVNDEEADERTMHYQLTVNNTSELKRTNLAVMDILPVVGDKRLNNSSRESMWQLYYDDIVSVKVNGTATDNYKIYYYTGDATQFNAASIKSTINAAKTGCPDGWTASYPGSGTATAIIVAFGYDPADVTSVTDSKTVVLEPGKNLQIEYTAVTPYREAEELNEIVFTNAANDFNYGFKTFPASSTADQAFGDTVLDSNVVEVTIAPPLVKVGGDVWIDADDNGVQDDGPQSWYLGFDIVKQLIRDLSVSLTTSNQKDQTPTGTTDGTINETGNDPDNYGIAHFEFDQLLAAKLRDGGTDYVNWNANGNANLLVGKNPFTYHMDIEYKGNTFTKTINTIDPRGSYPPSAIPTADQKDDNFEAATGTSGAYRNEWFFLHQTSNIFDMSKDIGWNVKRELNLTKTSKSTGEAIQGAEFTVYGPFEHDTGSSATLSDANKVGTYTTDADGKIKVTGLQFFKEYVIVETKAGTGFSIDGATGTGVNISEISTGKWLLGVPATTQTTTTENMIVQDPELIKVAVEKVWDDNNDEFGDRPESIWVDLFTDKDCKVPAKDVNGTDVPAKELKASNDWKAEWTSLPRYNGETVIQYYVKEMANEAFTVELVGYNCQPASSVNPTTGNVSFTLTNTPDSTGIIVTKEFSGNNLVEGDYGKNIKSIIFDVQRKAGNGNWTSIGKTLTVTRAENGTYPAASMTGLPTHDKNGAKYEYRAIETKLVLDDGTEIVIDATGAVIGGYSVETGEPVENADKIYEQTIKNKLTPGKIQIKKVWDDNNNSDGTRPAEIKVHITAKTDYYTYNKEVTLTARDNWTSTEYTVPVKDVAGNEITYHIEEDKVTGYTTTYSATDVKVEQGKTSTVTVTNKYSPIPTEIAARKEWKDNNNAYLTRPESIEFTLYAKWTDGEGAAHEYVIKKDIDGKDLKNPVTVKETDSWAAKWENLPQFQPGEIGKKLTYRVEETAINGYTTTYGTDGSTIVVYNTPVTTGLEVTKEFKGEILKVGQYIQSITFKVQRKENGKWVDVKKNGANVPLTVTRNAGGTCTTDSVNDLPKFDKDGNAYEYQAVEVSMVVKKGDAEETVSVIGTDMGGYVVSSENGTNDAGFTTTVTNELKPGKLQVKKVWDDNDNRDGVRPDSVKVTVKGSSKYFDKTWELTINKVEGNEWLSEVLTVPAKDEAGNEIKYSIVEDPVAKYTTTYSFTENVTVESDKTTTATVTNKYEPQPTKVEVKKDWKDKDDEYGTRPGSIEFTLYAQYEGGEKYVVEVDQDGKKLTNPVTVTSAENWQTKWENLPEYQVGQVGKKLTYTVEETAINGFTTTYVNKDGVWTFTNTPTSTSLHVKKTWSGEIEGIGNDIKSVTFTVQSSVKGADSWADVKKNGQNVTVPIERKNNAEFAEADVTGLPEFDSNGDPLEYRAVETSMVVGSETVEVENGEIGGYYVTEDHSKVNISEIENSYEPGSLKIVKDWQDDENRDGYRPEELKVKITAKTNYFEYEKTLTLNAGNHWGADLDAIELPVKDEAGNEITYKITEDTVNKYTATYKITAEDVTVDGTGVESETGITEDVETTDEYKNFHKPETTVIEAEKIWADENDKYGDRPETIEFTLYRKYNGLEVEEEVTEDEDGNEITPLEVKEGADHTWKVKWENLPVYKEGEGQHGNKITYSVKETKINGMPVDEFYGYTIDENGLKVTNTPVETELEVTKTWANDLTMPDIANSVSKVTFQVERSIDGSSWENVKLNGSDYTVSIERTNGGEFGSKLVKGLPAYNKDSKPYTYRAVEISITVNGTDVPVEGGKVIDSGVVGGYNASGSHTPGVDADPKKATAKDLSAYRNELKLGSVMVRKHWDDNENNNAVRPASLEVTLSATVNGKAFDLAKNGFTVTKTLSGSDAEDWTATWTGLPVYDAAGHEFTYTVTENLTNKSYEATVVPDGQAITEGEVTELAFKNKLIPTTFEVEKIFPDKDDPLLATFADEFESQIKSITVKLQKYDIVEKKWVDAPRKVTNDTVVELTKDTEWKHTWENLPLKHADGTLVQYRAIEVSITTITLDDEGNNLTHTVTYGTDETSGTVTAFNYTSETTTVAEGSTAKTTISNKIKVGRLIARKVWDDDNDRDNLRPNDILFHLWRNGVKLPEEYDKPLDGQKAVSMDDENNFVEWKKLPVFDVDGTEYVYAYTETMGSADSGSGSGEEPAMPAIQMLKKLFKSITDGNGGGETNDGEPADGEPTEVTPGEGEGEETFEIIEDSNGDYTATVEGTPASLIEGETTETKVTNKHEPLTTIMSVKKDWEGNFIYGDQPESVTVYLYATYETNDPAEPAEPADPAEQTDPAETTEPAEQSGNATVTELAAPEHAETVFLNPVTLSAENNWEYTWEDLPVNKTGYVGHKITYSVVEEPVPNGYEVEVTSEEELYEHKGSVDVMTDKFTVTNTMIETGLDVNKSWINEEGTIANKIKSVTFKVQRSVDGGTTWTDLVNTETGEAVTLTITKTESTASIDGLPTFSANGLEYQYRAIETGYTLKADDKFIATEYDENTQTSGQVGAYSYTSETSGNIEEGFVTEVVNDQIKGSLIVEKAWKGGNDNDRPKSLKVTLRTFAGDEEITLKDIAKSTDLNKSNDWTDAETWAEVPVYDEAGNQIVYMLTEPVVKKHKSNYSIIYMGKEIETGDGTSLSTVVYSGAAVKGKFTNRKINDGTTGDEAPLAAAGGAFAVGLAGLAAVLAQKKKRRS